MGGVPGIGAAVIFFLCDSCFLLTILADGGPWGIEGQQAGRGGVRQQVAQKIGPKNRGRLKNRKNKKDSLNYQRVKSRVS